MATTVGLLHLELSVAQATSLKDKRRVIKSFKDRTANAFNVSIAEVGALDDRRRAVLAVTMARPDRPYWEGALQKIINAAATHPDRNLTAP